MCQSDSNDEKSGMCLMGLPVKHSTVLKRKSWGAVTFDIANQTSGMLSDIKSSTLRNIKSWQVWSWFYLWSLKVWENVKESFFFFLSYSYKPVVVIPMVASCLGCSSGGFLFSLDQTWALSLLYWLPSSLVFHVNKCLLLSKLFQESLT